MNTIKLCSQKTFYFLTVFYFLVTKDVFLFLGRTENYSKKQLPKKASTIDCNSNNNSSLEPAQFNAIAKINYAVESLDKYVHLRQNLKLPKLTYLTEFNVLSNILKIRLNEKVIGSRLRNWFEEKSPVDTKITR